MVKCLLCGREFKNEAGLSGHLRMAHPSASTVDGHKLEARLEAVEASVSGLRAIVKEVTPALQGLTATIGDIIAVQTETQALFPAWLLIHVEKAHGAKVDTDELPEAVRIMFKKLRKGVK